jgi:hypothetical protein
MTYVLAVLGREFGMNLFRSFKVYLRPPFKTD